MITGKQKGNPYEYLVEYCSSCAFTKAIRKLNIKVSEQKVIFDKCMTEFKDLYKDRFDSNAPYQSLIDSIAQVVNDNKLDIDVEKFGDIFFKNLNIEDYKIRTDFAIVKTGSLFISPFLDQFYNRSFAIKDCSDVYALKINDSKNTTKILNANGVKKLDFSKDYMLIGKNNKGINTYYHSLTAIDKAGVSELYKYLSGSDMSVIEQAFSQNYHLINKMQKWSNKDVALGLLKRLREDGYDFEVNVGGSGGSGEPIDIDITINGTNITVPIFRYNANVNDLNKKAYVNQIFDGDKVYRFSTTAYSSQNVMKQYINPDVDDMMDLINYAMGKDITMRNGVVFNNYTEDLFKSHVSGKKEFNNSYVNSKGGTTIALRDYANGEGAITIFVEPRNKKNFVTINDDYLSDSLFNAMENIKTQVLDYYLTFTYSDDKFIQSLQQKMVDKDLNGKELEDEIWDLLGYYNAGDLEPKFDPILLAKFMNSELPHINRANIVKFMKDRDLSDVNLFSDEVDRLDLFKNDLIKFDASNAKSLSAKSPFFKEVGDVLTKTFEGCGYDVWSLEVDDKGVIHYVVNRLMKQTGSDQQRISGYIGQIFEPDNNGVIKTNYATTNYTYVPGYEALILANKDGEDKDLYERTKLLGYKQRLFDELRYKVRNSITGISTERESDIDMTTDLNKLYGHLYSERYPDSYLDDVLSVSGDKEFTDMLIKTIGRRVAYPKVMAKESSVVQYINKENNPSIAQNDRLFSYFALTGFRNMGEYDVAADGYFDSIATVTASAQLRVRYLVDSAVVNNDGMIIKGDENDRVALMKHDYFKTFDYDTFDRIQMTFSNILQSICITKEPIGVIQSCAGGYNTDDGMVISSDFAKKYSLTIDGVTRPIQVGDKISDLHGNKGTISIVVDRNKEIPNVAFDELSTEDKLVKVFKDNPDADIWMSSFSAVSRCNAGLAREIIDNGGIKDLVIGDRVDKGRLGKTRILITNKVVEHAVNIEDGRNSSSQLGWVLNAMGADELFHSFYESNPASYDMASYMSVMGLNMDTNAANFGNVYLGGQKKGEVVKAKPSVDYFSFMPSPRFSVEDEFGNPCKVYRKDDYGEIIEGSGRVVFDPKKVRADFEKAVSEGKTKLLIPFDLELPFGKIDGKSYTLKESSMYPGFYELPILKSNLMNTMVMSDGEVSTHRYMKAYTDIAIKSAQYIYAQNKGLAYIDMIKNREDLKDKDYLIKDFASVFHTKFKLDNYKAFADDFDINSDIYSWTETGLEYICIKGINDGKENSATRISYLNRSDVAGLYNKITNDIKSRYFEHKHNFAKDGIMKVNVKNSGTALWTSNPSLDLDEALIPKYIADKFKIKDGDLASLWRDPLLHTGGSRVFRATISDNIQNIAINPVVAVSFEGDFDGDKIGFCKIKEKYRESTFDAMSMRSNLLNTSLEPDENGYYDFYMQNDLDLAVARSLDSELDKEFKELRKFVNEEYQMQMSKNGKFMCDKYTFDRYNDWVHKALNLTVASASIDYTDIKSHVKSVYDACIATGAKGNIKKLREYMYYLGATDGKSEGDIDFDNIVDNKASFRTRQDIMDTQVATTVKATMVGLSGRVSQVGAQAFGHNKDTFRASLNVNAPVTQSIVQAKKDADEAKRKAHVVLNVIPEFLDGVKIQKKDGVWNPVVVNGNYVKYTDKNEWINDAKEFYFDKDGVNVKVNTDCFKTLANDMERRLRTDWENSADFNENTEFYPISFNKVKQLYGSNLDYMAYEKNFYGLVKKVADGDFNLFENSENYKPTLSIQRKEEDKVLFGDFKNREESNKELAGLIAGSITNLNEIENDNLDNDR